MSSSSVRLFAECAGRFVDGYEPKYSEAKQDGNLFDVRLLTPGMFDAKYSIQPDYYEDEVMVCPVCRGQTDSQSCKKCNSPRVKTTIRKDWNANSRKCSEWIDRQRGLEKEIVTGKELAECDSAIERFRSDEIIAAFLDSSDKQVHVTADWQDEKTGIIVPCQCLIDLVPKTESEFGRCLGDAKRTKNAGLHAWSRWAFQVGYHVQGGWNTDMYCAATGEDRNTFCFLIQESYPPWQTGKRMLAQDHGLDFGRGEYQRMLAFYCACLKSGRWPGYDDHEEAVQGWSIVAAEPWMESRILFEQKYDLPDLAEEQAVQREDDIIP